MPVVSGRKTEFGQGCSNHYGIYASHSMTNMHPHYGPFNDPTLKHEATVSFFSFGIVHHDSVSNHIIQVQYNLYITPPGRRRFVSYCTKLGTNLV